MWCLSPILFLAGLSVARLSDHSSTGRMIQKVFHQVAHTHTHTHTHTHKPQQVRGVMTHKKSERKTHMGLLLKGRKERMKEEKIQETGARMTFTGTKDILFNFWIR